MKFKHLLLLIFLAPILIVSCTKAKQEKAKQPNIVIVFLDDSGYNDFSPFGDAFVETPNVSKLAEEGVTFKNFYVPQAICSASRAALLTGCYPEHLKVFGAFAPRDRGMDTAYPTLGEVFSAAGYKTGFFGKWHIGDQEDTRPQARGFQETAGIMYSNDMWLHHPANPDYWGKFPMQFWENGKVIIEEVDSADQPYFTQRFTKYAVDFINRHKDDPFLLYVPHPQPHVPIFCSPEFEGKSGKGLYADVILELDWSVGQINQALKDKGIDENTIFVFTSDNGPWIVYGNHAGSTPFREAKSTSFDGGTRSATIIKYPAKLAGNRQSETTLMTIDLLPTLCELAGVPLPESEIDGKNVWDLIDGKEGAVNPHQYYAFTVNAGFEAIMSGDGKWKLHMPHAYQTMTDFEGKDGKPGKMRMEHIELSLFDMANDPYETTDVKDQHPEIVEQLLKFAQQHKEKYFPQQ